MPKYAIAGAAPTDTVELKLEPDDDGDPTLWARGPGGAWAALLYLAPGGALRLFDGADDDEFRLNGLLQFTDGQIDVN